VIANIKVSNKVPTCSVCRTRVIFFEEIKLNGMPARLPLYRREGTKEGIKFCSPSCSLLYAEVSLLFLTDKRIQKFLDIEKDEMGGKSTREMAEGGKSLGAIMTIKAMLDRGVDVGKGVDDE